MTFYYDTDENDLVGNRAVEYAEFDGDSLVIDVDHIMDEGRGVRKLREMRDAVDSAIEAVEK